PVGAWRPDPAALPGSMAARAEGLTRVGTHSEELAPPLLARRGLAFAHPLLGPPVLGPLVLGPPVLGPLVLGPPVLGPPVLGPRCRRRFPGTGTGGTSSSTRRAWTRSE